jgi:hypothetical protein
MRLVVVPSEGWSGIRRAPVRSPSGSTSRYEWTLKHTSPMSVWLPSLFSRQVLAQYVPEVTFLLGHQLR